MESTTPPRESVGEGTPPSAAGDPEATTHVAPEAAPMAPRRPHRGRFLLLLLLVTMVALGVRLYRLDAPSVWVDELFSVTGAAEVMQGEWTSRPLAHVPTALYLAASGIDLQGLALEGYGTWRGLGIDERLIRMPWMLIGVIGVFVLAALSRPLVGSRGAVLLALLLTFSAWHVWVSQTARFYTLQFLLYNLCLLLYYRGTSTEHTPHYRTLAAAALCFVLVFLTQVTSLMIVAVFAADWIFSRLRGEPVRLGTLGWVAVGAAVLIGGLLVGPRFFFSLSTYTEFQGNQQSATDLVQATVFLVGTAPVVLAVLALPWLYRQQPRATAYLAIAALLPLVTFMALATIGADVHVRYTFVALFAWLALAAAGLDVLWQTLRPRAGRLLAAAPVLIVLGTMLMSLYLYYHAADGYRVRWADAWRYVETHREPGQAVAGDTIAHIIGRYYLQEEDVTHLRPGRPLREDLQQLEQPTWIVLRNDAPTEASVYGWLNPVAPLQAYFTARSQPYSSVQVHYYDPAPRADPPAAADAGAP